MYNFSDFWVLRWKFTQFLMPFLHQCSVSWKITPLYFLAETHILWTKTAHRSEIFGLLSGWLKIHKIPHVVFEIVQVSFSSNFASIFNLMRDNSSVFFKLKLYMIFKKVTHESAQFQIFDCSGKISPNLYFDRLLLLKVYRISAKLVQRIYVSWYWRVM